MTTAATTTFCADHEQSINAVLLIDIRASVAAIPNGALPRQPAFKMYADELSDRLCKLLSEVDSITGKTVSNVRAMVKMACVESLEARIVADLATQRLAAASTPKATATAEKAVAKAADVLTNPPKSLKAASVAGRRIVDRKTSTCDGFQKQTPASKAAAKKRTAKPTVSEIKEAADKRKAKKELILQALSNAKDIATDDDADNEQVRVALRAVAHCADDIISFLPADMRTL